MKNHSSSRVTSLPQISSSLRPCSKPSATRTPAAAPPAPDGEADRHKLRSMVSDFCTIRERRESSAASGWRQSTAASSTSLSCVLFKIRITSLHRCSSCSSSPKRSFNGALPSFHVSEGMTTEGSSALSAMSAGTATAGACTLRMGVRAAIAPVSTMLLRCSWLQVFARAASASQPRTSSQGSCSQFLKSSLSFRAPASSGSIHGTSEASTTRTMNTIWTLPSMRLDRSTAFELMSAERKAWAALRTSANGTCARLMASCRAPCAMIVFSRPSALDGRSKLSPSRLYPSMYVRAVRTSFARQR
mmetsp:Transcript_15070/g.57215  ORF Transcript_15070/g.57215 Transcript_15070/m.57215 type:complete len:303 (-) Transcript_15070:3438-4346(-)